MGNSVARMEEAHEPPPAEPAPPAPPAKHDGPDADADADAGAGADSDAGADAAADASDDKPDASLPPAEHGSDEDGLASPAAETHPDNEPEGEPDVEPEAEQEEPEGGEEEEEEPKHVISVDDVKTAPHDFRFPTTNQAKHCYTRYNEYHKCVTEKGEGAQECAKFQKYYRSLCPGDWVDKWNEQRENGTFPGRY